MHFILLGWFYMYYVNKGMVTAIKSWPTTVHSAMLELHKGTGSVSVCLSHAGIYSKLITAGSCGFHGFTDG